MTLCAKTDKGRVRSSNQDAYRFLALGESALFALICDGMGGPSGGQIASTTAVEVVEQVLTKGYDRDMPPDEIRDLMMLALREANGAIRRRALSNADIYGMGTTAVLCVVTGSLAIIANVGDSRVYHMTGGVLTQITKDHSVVQDMVDKGQITKSQVRHHAQKNIITRVLGVDDSCEPDFFTVDISPGDTLLLCSDGLTNMLDETQISFELTVDTSQCTCEKLVELANEAGGQDNITVIVAKF